MKPPTLIDAIYKSSFRPETNPGWLSNSKMRHAIESAHSHRFIADTRMSAFMADLANNAFLKHEGTPINARICDSLRVQSRLPHDTIWVEFNLREYLRRAAEIRQVMKHDLDLEFDDRWDESPHTEGWLIQQHPKIDTACILHMFHYNDAPDPVGGYHYYTFPLTYAWCCDDSPLPWEKVVDNAATGPEEIIVPVSTVLTGMIGYKRDNVGIVTSPLIVLPTEFRRTTVEHLFSDWMGVIRRVWALLATIDNLPLSVGTVRQSKGFLARGRIRRYLDHKTITLNIPAKKDVRVVARQAIAMAHRKRHEVRGHWRDDFRHRPSARCNPHLWESVDDNADHIQCALCHGRQIYVHKHERGDAALGYVTHDYVLKHETEKKRA